MRIWSCLFILSVIAISTCSSYAVVLETNDGLSLEIDSNGAFGSLHVDRKSILSTERQSGIEIRDYVSGQAEVISAKPQSVPGGVILTGKSATLSLSIIAEFRSCGDRIECNVTIRDLSGKDRCVQAGPVFYLAGEKWQWGGFGGMQSCDVGKEYQISEPIPWPRRVARLPFCYIGEPEVGAALGLAARMDIPRIYRIVYKQESNCGALRMVNDLGISPATKKFPSETSFSFVLQRLPGEKGLRGAAAKYYESFPQFFLSRASRTGTWTLWAPKNVFGWWEFGIAYDQMQLNPKYVMQASQIATDDRDGLLSIVYTEPQAYYAGYGKAGQEFKVTQESLEAPFYADRNLPDSIIDNAIIPGVSRASIVKAVLNSAIEDQSGNWQRLHWTTRFGRGFAGWTMLLLNPDPDLPRPNRASVSWEHEVLAVKETGVRAGGQIDGVYIDSLQGFAGMSTDNYRRGHWAVADIPLTFNYETKMPVQMHGMALMEYLNWLRKECDDRGWMILGNGWFPHYIYSAHLFDVMGATENNALRMGDYWLGLLRALAGGKPVSILDYSLVRKTVKNEAEEMERLRKSFSQMLVWNIMPGTADWTEEGIERVRPFMRKYVPESVSLGQAGWRPITGAEGQNLQIERYGDYPSKSLSLVVRNPADKDVENAVVKLDLSELGIPSNARLRAIRLPDYSRVKVNAALNEISVGKLAAGDALVLRVGLREHLLRFQLDRCGFYYAQLQYLLNAKGSETLAKAIELDKMRASLAESPRELAKDLAKLQAEVSSIPESRNRQTGMFYLDQMSKVLAVVK